MIYLILSFHQFTNPSLRNPAVEEVLSSVFCIVQWTLLWKFWFLFVPGQLICQIQVWFVIMSCLYYVLFFWWSRSTLTTFPNTAERLTALFSKRQIEGKFPSCIILWTSLLCMSLALTAQHEALWSGFSECWRCILY